MKTNDTAAVLAQLQRALAGQTLADFAKGMVTNPRAAIEALAARRHADPDAIARALGFASLADVDAAKAAFDRDERPEPN